MDLFSFRVLLSLQPKGGNNKFPICGWDSSYSNISDFTAEEIAEKLGCSLEQVQGSFLHLERNGYVHLLRFRSPLSESPELYGVKISHKGFHWKYFFIERFSLLLLIPLLIAFFTSIFEKLLT